MARTVTQRGPHEPAKGGWFPIRLDSRVAEQQALEGGSHATNDARGTASGSKVIPPASLCQTGLKRL